MTSVGIVFGQIYVMSCSTIYIGSIRPGDIEVSINMVSCDHTLETWRCTTICIVTQKASVVRLSDIYLHVIHVVPCCAA